MNKREGDWPPVQTFTLIFLLIVIFWWFLRGQSFRLYASLFFLLYSVTNLSWLSIILVSVVQNVVLMPLSLLNEKLYPQVKDFEGELEKVKGEDQQYIVFKGQVRQGNWAVLVYILNFVILAMAFISAGRVFLLEFYHSKINPWFLWKFVPYPEYPLKGTIFSFPIVKITQTMAVSWKNIFLTWLIVLAFFAVLRILWMFVRNFLPQSNDGILGLRIKYNRLTLALGGLAGTFFVISTYVLRNLPTGVQLVIWTADLAKQNTTFNIVTATATFAAALYSGMRHNLEGKHMAEKDKLPQELIDRVFKSRNKRTLRNAILVAGFAYGVTHLMPCSHDLSVLAFEVIYIIIAPRINKLILGSFKKKTVVPTETPVAPIAG